MKDSKSPCEKLHRCLCVQLKKAAFLETAPVCRAECTLRILLKKTSH